MTMNVAPQVLKCGAALAKFARGNDTLFIKNQSGCRTIQDAVLLCTTGNTGSFK